MKGFSVILPIIWSEFLWKQSIWNTSAFGDQNSNQSPALGLICSHQVYMLQLTLSGGGTVEREVLCFHGPENGNRRLVIGPTSPWQLQSKFQKLLGNMQQRRTKFPLLWFSGSHKATLINRKRMNPLSTQMGFITYWFLLSQTDWLHLDVREVFSKSEQFTPAPLGE